MNFLCIFQGPPQPNQPYKFTILENCDRIKEEFNFLQTQYHRCVLITFHFFFLSSCVLFKFSLFLFLLVETDEEKKKCVTQNACAFSLSTYLLVYHLWNIDLYSVIFFFIQLFTYSIFVSSILCLYIWVKSEAKRKREKQKEKKSYLKVNISIKLNCFVCSSGL